MGSTVAERPDARKHRQADGRQPRQADGRKPESSSNVSPVTAEPLRETVERLAGSAEALAALGATLRIRLSGQRAEPAVEAALRDVVAALGIGESVRAASPAELEAALAPIAGAVHQAQDLLSDPWRSPGWSYTDIDLLETQGRSSAAFAGMLQRVVAPALGDLADRLAQPGAALLEVGVGVARLAIEVSAIWPELRVVGIDPWDPALAVARRNVAQAALEERIELRPLGVEDLEDDEAFDAAWVSAAFVPRRVLEPGLERVRVALRPGGWAILALDRPGAGLEQALARVRTARAGGAALTKGQAETLLRAVGFEDAAAFEVEAGAQALLVAARRP